MNLQRQVRAATDMQTQVRCSRWDSTTLQSYCVWSSVLMSGTMSLTRVSECKCVKTRHHRWIKILKNHIVKTFTKREYVIYVIKNVIYIIYMLQGCQFNLPLIIHVYQNLHWGFTLGFVLEVFSAAKFDYLIAFIFCFAHFMKRQQSLNILPCDASPLQALVSVNTCFKAELVGLLARVIIERSDSHPLYLILLVLHLLLHAVHRQHLLRTFVVWPVWRIIFRPETSDRDKHQSEIYRDHRMLVMFQKNHLNAALGVLENKTILWKIPLTCSNDISAVNTKWGCANQYVCWTLERCLIHSKGKVKSF